MIPLTKSVSQMILDPADAFITRWKTSGGGERANYQLFLSELCDLIQVPRPNPTRADDRLNVYVFERAVSFRCSRGMSRTRRIDLYQRGCFVLEAKQGRDHKSIVAPAPARIKQGTAIRGSASWQKAMNDARIQAEAYVQALPPWEGWPPFLIVVDVGHSIELFADFSNTGTEYAHFPDPKNCLILLEDLAKPEIRGRLAKVWTSPQELDPMRHALRPGCGGAEPFTPLTKTRDAATHTPKGGSANREPA